MTVSLWGTKYLIDTSAAARMAFHESIRTTIETLIDDGIAATCITVDLEASFSAKPNDVERLFTARREHLIQLPISLGIEARARDVATLLAQRGLHRAAGSFDILTAAIAEQYHAIVLHYDADFEHIASVTGQQHQWIAPRGSID